MYHGKIHCAAIGIDTHEGIGDWDVGPAGEGQVQPSVAEEVKSCQPGPPKSTPSLAARLVGGGAAAAHPTASIRPDLTAGVHPVVHRSLISALAARHIPEPHLVQLPLT